MIYHSLPKKVWEFAQSMGEYAPDSLEKDGFIHTSNIDQIIAITQLVFPEGRDDLVLLEIDEKKVKAKVILEDLKGHGRFAHIYGPLNLDAVLNVYEFEKESNPTAKVKYKLPKELRISAVQLN